MNYSYALHEEAFEEYTQALEWYEGRGQAERYRNHIKKAIAAIRDNPFAWQVEEKDDRFRRYVVDTFPFKVVYAVHEADKHVYIIAIASTYRKPGYWMERTE